MNEIYVNEKNEIIFERVNEISSNENILILDKNITPKKIKKQMDSECLLLIKVDKDTTEVEYKNILKVLDNSKIKIGKIVGNKKFIGYIEEIINNEIFQNFLDGLIAVIYENVEEKYNYIYDSVCDKLDEEFRKKNLCDFKNDQCVANRAGATVHETMGCCYSFKYSTNPLKFIDGVHLCDHIKSKSCDIKCIGCKLFTCKYLKEKGISFKAKDIFLIDTFFNKKQQEIIERNLFFPKEKIIEKLISDKDDKKPYWLYYAKDTALIDEFKI